MTTLETGFALEQLEQRAAEFAEVVHGRIDHKRKYTGEPYTVHLKGVANIVRTVPGHTKFMLAAAHLHDTREDAGVTHEQILAEFGPEVAELVDWLTDVSKPSDGNRAVRKELDRQHIAQAPGAAQTLKVADLIDNTRSIVQHDPEFARTYLAEKERLLEVLVRADPELLAYAYKLLQQSQMDIALRPR